MAATMSNALAAMRGKRALLVGDLVLDSYVYGETVRVSREAPVLVVRKERAEHRLGGAANTAANLATLGLLTDVVGVVSDDDNGATLRRMLAAAGVRVEGLRGQAGATAVKTRVLAGAFGTSRQQVLRIDEEPHGKVPERVLAEVARDVRERGRAADVVVVSDYGYGLATEALADACRELVGAGVPVCVDSRHDSARFAGVTAVTPNVPEAEALAGVAISSPESVVLAGARIVERLGLTACLLTQGRHGMTLFRRGAAPAHVGIVGEEEVTDVTGAGDTVIATFSAALAAGLGMENGMRLANTAAGIVVTKVGTATARPDEIAALAAQHAVELSPWAV